MYELVHRQIHDISHRHQLLQMTVVEAYAGGKKMESPDNKSELSEMLSSLLIEGIAQNTNGGVYVPEVFNLFVFYIIPIPF